MLVDSFDAIQELLGEPPYALSKDLENETKKDEAVTTTTTKNVVLSDGTYASVTKTETTGGVSAETAKLSNLRRLVSNGDILLGTVAVVSMTKLALKASGHHESNRLVTDTLLAAAGLGRLAELKRGARVGVHADCLERLTQCCRVLLEPSLQNKLKPIFLKACQESYRTLVARQKAIKNKATEEEKKGRASNPDDLIQFRQLRAQAVQGGIEVDLMDADDISRAVGADGANQEANKMRHVYQLTGFSDPVYAEASVTVHDYDIVLEMLIINRTPNTLTNLTVELATMGDLKIVERPQSHTIGPLDERRFNANIKVSSTETGHIFGTIVFDNSSTAQKTYVNLNDIQLDIMDYIRAGECNPDDFRSMWAEFEWENKVAINTTTTDLYAFLKHIIVSTNMTCLNPPDESTKVNFALLSSVLLVSEILTHLYFNFLQGLDGSNFLAANLYARSVFGEDALVNVSVEKKEDLDGKLGGYIRIRSKTQGIALSLGDRITNVQRMEIDGPAAPTPATGAVPAAVASN